MKSTVVQDFGKSALSLLRSAVDGLNYLLWPPVCQNCNAAGKETAGGLCNDCWSAVLQCSAGDYCPRCGKDVSRFALTAGACPACQNKDIPYEGIARGGVYTGALRELILAFKFHDRTELAPVLCKIAESAVQGSFFRDTIDYFVPVPLHWLRRFERGYNQSYLIARGLKNAGAVSTDLARIRYTERQLNLTAAGRKKNVAGAFAVRKGHKYSGKNVCLVDDITTSGATLNECARVLTAAGAKKVFALVVAVAMQEHDG